MLPLQICVAVLLGGAAYTDIRYKRIPNIWIIIWMLIGVYYKGYVFIINMLLVCLILLIMYIFKFIGAGDIKLISLVFGYLNWYQAGIIMCVGFVMAAIYAFINLYCRGYLAGYFYLKSLCLIF